MFLIIMEWFWFTLVPNLINMDLLLPYDITEKYEDPINDTIIRIPVDCHFS